MIGTYKAAGIKKVLTMGEKYTHFIKIKRFFFRNYLSQKNVIEKLEDGIPSGRHAVMVENSFHLLSYVSTSLSSSIVSSQSSNVSN